MEIFLSGVYSVVCGEVSFLVTNWLCHLPPSPSVVWFTDYMEANTFIEFITCNCHHSIVAHHSSMTAAFVAVLYNKSMCLSDVEVVWFGNEKFSFEL